MRSARASAALACLAACPLLVIVSALLMYYTVHPSSAISASVSRPIALRCSHTRLRLPRCFNNSKLFCRSPASAPTLPCRPRSFCQSHDLVSAPLSVPLPACHAASRARTWATTTRRQGMELHSRIGSSQSSYSGKARRARRHQALGS